jgi:hypothetical protein
MVTLPDKKMSVNVLTNNWDASASRIAFGVAGIIDSTLTPPHRMKEQRDAAPEITEKTKNFLSAMLSGNGVSDYVTPELATHLFSMPKTPPGAPSPLRDISFISHEDVEGKGFSRHGVRISSMRHYRAVIMDDTVFLTIYYNQDGKIADYSGI